MDWDRIVQQWQAVLDAVARLGGEASELVIEAPASEREVTAMERQLDVTLPSSLREALLNFSKKVQFSWYLPEDFPRPEALEEIAFGGFELSLGRIVEIELRRREVVNQMRAHDAGPEVIASWDKRFAFLDISIGDCLAIEQSRSADEAVIYLSHDDPEVQDQLLGRNFQDFLARWSSLGCPGPEWWGWDAFVGGKHSCIDPNCANAKRWKRTLGLDS